MNDILYSRVNGNVAAAIRERMTQDRFSTLKKALSAAPAPSGPTSLLDADHMYGPFETVLNTVFRAMFVCRSQIGSFDDLCSRHRSNNAQFKPKYIPHKAATGPSFDTVTCVVSALCLALSLWKRHVSAKAQLGTVKSNGQLHAMLCVPALEN